VIGTPAAPCRARVGGLRQRLEQREVGQRGDQAAGHDDRLAADAVGQRAEHDEERRADQQRQRDQDVGGGRLDLQCLRQEEQRVELARVPDHGLAGGQATSAMITIFRLRHSPKDSVSGALEVLPSSFIFLKGRRLVHAEPDPHADGEQEHRDQEGDAPAPGGEGLLAHQGAGAEDDQQRQEQAERRVVWIQEV
jgi:hypothetical protein